MDAKSQPTIVVEDSNNDKHLNSQQPQPQSQLPPQQQEKREGLALKGEDGDLEKEKTAKAIPFTTSTTGKKPDFASLVRRAHQQAQQESGVSTVHLKAPATAEIDGHDHLRPVLSHHSSSGENSDYLHLHSGRPSSVYNVLPSPEHGPENEHQHSSMFHKIFSKDSVRNALSLNSAASAFTKSNRTSKLGTVDIPVASLAVTGAGVPAFWLRRDDKGRRPPPVLFQMLRVAVTDSEVDQGVIKQIIFRVELQYGDVKWVIRRTALDFFLLHVALSAKRFGNWPEFPNQRKHAWDVTKASIRRNDAGRVGYLRQKNLERRQAFQDYLLKVLQRLSWTISYDLYEFLEISAMSLTKDMGWKGKEAYVETKVTDLVGHICGFKGISRWVKNWAILRDSYMAFCPNIGSDEPTDVFIFDQTFYVEHQEHAMGLNMHHIVIGNSHRKIEFKGEHNREMLEWMDHFERMKQSSPWVKGHRFGSFAPEREEAKVRYYVDGKDYFHAVSDAILAAKTEIYICDWWLSPELYLRRPPEDNEEFRLDRLLKRKAMEGVMIYIVIYKEISLALTLDSAHTKIWLQDLHPNIQVQRHPDHLGVKTTQFWAHHEKICVIDCRLAFIGGLDLCFGRYDSRTHQLSDYHPSGEKTIWPGQDYSNPRIKDFVNVKDYSNDLIEKKLLARMPWHDVHLGVAGPPARDIARHFVQRWNLVKKEKAMKKSHMKFLTPKGEYVSTRNETGWTGTQKVQVLRSSTVWSQGVDLEKSIQTAYLECIAKAEHFIYIENQFFVTLAMEKGNPDIKNTIGIALFERIKRAYQEQKKFRVIVVMPLMPAFEADIMSSEAGTLRKVMHFQYVSICRGGNSLLERLVSEGIDPDQYIGFFGLRSFDRIKHGKFDAIVEAVREAEELRQQQLQKKNGDNQAQSSTLTQAQAQAQTATQSQDESSSANGSTLKGSSKDSPPAPTKGRSLASKFLLEPIPKGDEAARILAIADNRKKQMLDALKPWDESITKRAMNPAIREIGYIPAITESTLADEELNERIQRSTTEAEIEAGRHAYRKTGSTDAETLEGLGTVIKNGIENIKGYKDQGNLEPLGQKIRHHKERLFSRGSGLHADAAPVESSNIVVSHGYETTAEQAKDDEARLNKAKISEQEFAEAIVEPMSGGASGSEDQGAADGDNSMEDSADPGKFPKADKPGPVPVEKPVIDDEVDDFVTEQLYIHSKLMIVDDRIIICGSANINDRSQLGLRDSEIAMIIEDTEMVSSTMNGEPYQVGKLAHTLRVDLFKEHIGLLPHVDHDVVTQASVLPVDLDKPHKDPEEERLELMLKAQKEEQRLLQEEEQEEQQKQQQDRQYLQPQLDLIKDHPELELKDTVPMEGNIAGVHYNDKNKRSRRYTFGDEQEPKQGRGLRHRFSSRTGHVQVTLPNEAETEEINQWHALNSKASLKKLAADNPAAADESVKDPLHDDFYENLWKRVANTNTLIFREVFRCVPDDTVQTWDDYRKFVPNPKKVLTGHVAMEDATVEKVNEQLQKVTGHLVEFPTRFLMKENLLGGVVEGAVVPMEIFT